jgi:hypothetical protein
MKIIAPRIQAHDPPSDSTTGERAFEGQIGPRPREFVQTTQHDPPGCDGRRGGIEGREPLRDGVRIHEHIDPHGVAQ